MRHAIVRTRFAPSPTGGLHIGGVRTALYSYLFAKKNQGQFILRIEDTDNTRFVKGAEQYIIDALTWSGIIPDEAPHLPSKNSQIGSYRQSERKAIYLQYAQQLVTKGYAYYAFETEEELQKLKLEGKTYNYEHRQHLRNSLSLSPAETEALLHSQPYVVRFKNEPHEQIIVQDEIRGEVYFDSSLLDDKILLKSDGMPTYHLAVVVDDYLMKISHVFRGEEWLPSAPIHVKLWQQLGWADAMPHWVHLPLILSPTGHGKLSKREARQLSIPIFPLNWNDEKLGEQFVGFRESGFLPEAFLNTLALIGWNPEGEQEIFSLAAMIDQFSLSHIHKAAARFDYEKAKWINHKHLTALSSEPAIIEMLRLHLPTQHQRTFDDLAMGRMFGLVIERCHLLSDFWTQSQYFFEPPQSYDMEAIRPSWSEAVQTFFLAFAKHCKEHSPTSASDFETTFKEMATTHELKAGKLMLPFRVMLVGGKFGTHLFDICELIGAWAVASRIERCIENI